MRHTTWLGRTGRAFLRSPSGPAAAVGLIGLLVLAVIGPILWGGHGATTENFANLNGQPSWAHPLGTDELGRDILDRTLSATRLSLELGSIAAAIALAIGFPLGGLVSMLSPRLRGLGRGAINTMLSFPSLLLAIVVVAIIGIGERGAVLAIAIGNAPYFARLSESLASSTVTRDYVASARVIGVRRSRLLYRYIMPNIAETLMIAGLTAIAESIIDVSALSFLGLGVQPPAYDWGALLTTGTQEVYLVPTAAIGPAVMIAITGIIVTLLAEALARSLNPALWNDGGLVRRPLLRGWRAAMAAAHRAGSPGTATAAAAAAGAPLLRVAGLTVTLPAARGPVAPVRGVSFEVGHGEVVGIVGESGSGKTMTALSLAALTPHSAIVGADELSLGGQELQRLSGRRLREVLGSRVAMVFQNPMASLNPAMRVGPQLTDGARTHRGLGRREAAARAAQMLTEVNIARPREAMHRFPFEFSGGMRQRAMIAMGLMSEPDLLIADEPTTALDVTVQSQVLDVLQRINRDHGTAILLISHNIGVVSELCHRVLVMYAGRVVEDLDVAALEEGPAHPYTQALMAAVPTLEGDRGRPLLGIPGTPWRLGDSTEGCAFAPRCPYALARCATDEPELLDRGGHRVACWVAGGAGEAAP